MKELIIHEGPRVEVISSPVPSPGPHEVVIRVVVAASNPKDHKYYLMNQPMNQGDDISGIIHSIGSSVTEFRPGDRVFAFHPIGTPHGAYAEYAVAPTITTYHLPPNTSFHSGATVPLAAFTAAWALHRQLLLPQPWTPATEPTPLLIYGASSAVGAFAVKLARASNIHPIVAVAGRGTDYVKTLIDPSLGDIVLDYRVGPDELQAQMTSALSSHVPDARTTGLFLHAFDAIAEPFTVSFCARVLKSHARFVHAMPIGDIALVHQGGEQGFKEEFREGVVFEIPSSLAVNGGAGVDVPGGKEFGYVWMRAFARGLETGWLTGHPFEVVEGGLDGVEGGLRRLRAGEVSARKLVYEVGEA